MGSLLPIIFLLKVLSRSFAKLELSYGNAHS